MYRWALKSSHLVFSSQSPGPVEGPGDSTVLKADLSSQRSSQSHGPNRFRRVRMPVWIKFIPFVMSGFLFLSGIFLLFAPLPLLALFLTTSRKWAWMAAIVNAALVYFAAGPIALHFYAIFILTVALFMPEFLKRGISFERSGAYALGLILLTACLTVVGYSILHQVNPWVEMKSQIAWLTEFMVQNLPPETRQQWMGTTEPDEWKSRMFVELPSAIGTVALAMVWINLTIIFRMNPKHIRERLGVDSKYLQYWKAPGWLVWPVIASGFFLLSDFGWPSVVAINVFKFLMAIYVIQGLSILSFLFDVWNIRGFFRSLGFVVAVVLMMPLLITIGFFDQWFDFRAKFRQS